MRAFPALPPGLRAAVVVAVTCLFVVLASWATLIGPDAVFTGPGPRPATVTTRTESCIPLPVRTRADGTTTEVVPDDLAERDYCEPVDTSLQDARDMASRAAPPLWVKLVVWGLEGTVLVAVLALLAWGALRLVRGIGSLRRTPERRVTATFETLDEPARVVDEMAGDAGHQLALLREGEPRNAIVAAWHRFEVQGERAGVPRRTSETSSEYALRILELVDADGGAVNRLAGLYREARFSQHAITEQHREAALAALVAIREGLAVRA